MAESLSSFARRHGVTRQAVAKACVTGTRFSRGVVARVDGVWRILDPERADVEWDRNALPTMRPSWPIRVAMKRLRSGGRE